MSCKFHNIRFYNAEPRAIHCMVLERESKKLAISRNDATIEIWDVKDIPYMCRVIAGMPSGSVEAMCWVQERLLSTGLSGAVVEWDLQSLTMKHSVIVTGQAAWCIDATRAATKMAVGTEQGYINIYSVEGGGIEYERIFDKQEGRILCCKFDPTGEFLVTGSIETIRVWNVSSGQALHRMSTGRAQRHKETIVWCLAVTSDMTVISGDSRGHLTFWDGRLGEQVESLTTHKADVLSICLSADERSLYCAGVDPLIVNYSKVRMKHKGDDHHVEKWVKNIQRNIHQHDVRVMVSLENKLFSAGVDGYLAMSSFPPKVLVKYPPLHQHPQVLFCPQTNMVCLRYTSSLELWKLGTVHSTKQGHLSYTADDLENGHVDTDKDKAPTGGEKETYSNDAQDLRSGRRLKLSEGAQLLLRLQTKSQEHLQCCALASNSQWIAYSTNSHMRIFKFSVIDNVPTLSRLVPLPAQCQPCYQMVFSPDSRSLVMATADCQLTILHIHDDGAVTVGQTIDARNVLKARALLHLIASPLMIGRSYYIALSDVGSHVGVWQVVQGEGGGSAPPARLLAQLPRHTSTPSAMTFDPHDNTLFVAYTDFKVVEYSLTHLRYTKLSEMLRGEAGLCSKWQGRLFPITGLSPHPSNPHLLMFNDDCAVYLINKAAKASDEPKPKVRKGELISRSTRLFCTIKKFKHLVAASWLGEEEAAVVIIEPDSFLEKLPPSFVKKRFGAM